MYPVEYSKLPNFNNLFLDYISLGEDEKNKLAPFFNMFYKDNDNFFRVIEDKIHNYNTNRYFDKNLLIDVLKRQNVEFGGTENTASNIELLKKEDAFAVVTGQQVGLYTGNMYTIYKTITAVKLTRNLKERFPQFNFVPVFWLESEDHDFEEANHANVLNKQNELIRIGFESDEQANEDDTSRRSSKPVGSTKLDEMVNSINEQLRSTLLDTDFKEKLMNIVTSCYKEDNDFKTAFAQMINSLMGDYGVVFIDCSDPEIKKLLVPVFEKELRTSPKMCEDIITASAELEKHYDLQVKPKVINMFYVHNGNRLLIEPREGGRFALKNSKRRFENQEIFAALQENPELFSPNVVLRPICQDYLLPTIAYVGGPAEISYYAQLKPAYAHYELTMPVIYPRASVSIIEGKINKFLSSYNLNFENVFHRNLLVTKVVEKLSEVKVDDEISRFTDELNKVFYEMKNMTARVDQTLLNSVDNMKEKLKQNIEILKGKLINAQAKKSEVMTSQIDKVTNNIFPKDNLQERVLNITYFINKYDISFIKKLYHEIDPLNFNHQIIDV